MKRLKQLYINIIYLMDNDLWSDRQIDRGKIEIEASKLDKIFRFENRTR